MSKKPTPGQRTDVAATVEPLAVSLVSELAGLRSSEKPIEEKYVERLRSAVLGQSLEGCVTACGRIERAGISRAEIIDRYIPAVAQNLGQEWFDDQITFVTTTVGSSRLQWLVGELDPTEMDPVTDVRAPCMLVLVPSGEHHTLGAVVLSSQLRRQGIGVSLILDARPETVVMDIQRKSVKATMISASSASDLRQVRSLIDASRMVMAKGSPVFIGGQVAEAPVNLTAVSGADHVATSTDEALRLCGIVG